MHVSLTNDHLSVATAAFVEYATAVDEARVDDFVNLFTPDAVFYRPNVVGHAAIAQLTREMLVQYTATSHHISNVRILGGDDEEFQAACHIYAWHHLLDGTDFEIWGQYRSRLRVHEGK